MNYLMPLWGGAPESLIKKAQVIQNAAARWSTGLGRRTRVTRLLDKTGWLSMEEQIRQTTAVFTWKLVHLGKPRRLLDRLQLNQDLSITINPPRLLFTKNCLRWRAVAQWNDLPQFLRDMATVGPFKKHLKKLILSERTWDPGD